MADPKVEVVVCTEHPAQEYVSCKGGKSDWRCVVCGDVDEQAEDCTGG